MDEKFHRFHHRPNGRPIHPRCAMLIGKPRPCTCDFHWRYWDGTQDGLDRLLDEETRKSARNSWGIQRSQPVYGVDPQDPLSHVTDRHAGDLTGFFKEDEMLKTVYDDMFEHEARDGDLNLDTEEDKPI